MMNNPIYTRLEKLLKRWGGGYIWRIQLSIEIAAFLAASLGIGFILLNVNFSTAQIIELIKVVFITVAFVNLCLVLVSYRLAPHARKRLDDWAKGAPLVSDENEIPAWHEIVATTWLFGIAAVILALVLVITPTVLYMYFVAGADFSQAIQIFLGGALSATGVIILNTLLLELALIPARLVLLPRDPSAQLSGLQTRGLRVRFQAYVISLTIVILLMLGPRSYQEAVNAMTSGGQNGNVAVFQIQIVIISVLAVMIGAGLTSLLVRTVELPIENLIQTLMDIQKGNIKSRTKIIGLDEVGQIGVYLNQTLDHMELLQTNLEGQIAERTRQLERNALQLRAAAGVARQNVGRKDISDLLNDIVRSVTEQLGLYYAGIFLFNETKEYAILQAAFPERGKMLLESGYGLKVERQNIVGLVVNDQRPIILAPDIISATLENPGFSQARSEVALPLVVQQNIIGILDLQSSEENVFSKDGLETLQVLADQISLAIENSRLLDESKAMISQLEVLASQQTQTTWRDYLKRPTPAYQFDPAGVKQVDLSARPNQKNDLRIPLILRGQEIGSIAIQRKDSPSWDAAERELAQKVAVQIALALENSRLLEETRQRASQEQIIAEISARLGRSLDVDTLLQTAARELGSLPEIAEVSVYIEPATKNNQRK